MIWYLKIQKVCSGILYRFFFFFKSASEMVQQVKSPTAKPQDLSLTYVVKRENL